MRLQVLCEPRRSAILSVSSHGLSNDFIFYCMVSDDMQCFEANPFVRVAHWGKAWVICLNAVISQIERDDLQPRCGGGVGPAQFLYADPGNLTEWWSSLVSLGRSVKY